jgi:hypothetical protein
VPQPVLYDAVTLRHFGTASRLDVLVLRHAHLDEPRWTEAVHGEIAAAAHFDAAARDVLAFRWLGNPVAPDAADLAAIMPLWIGLNEGRRPPVDHAGEAETLHFAEKLDAIVATDDNGAYDFVSRRLGSHRVIDTVAILQDAVAMGEITAAEAAGIAGAIRGAGRHLRRVHPTPLTANDFR